MIFDKALFFEILGSGGTGVAIKAAYDWFQKTSDGKVTKAKTNVEAATASEKISAEAETARLKVLSEAETAREKRLDESAMGLIDRLEKVVASNHEKIEQNEKRFSAAVDGLHERLDAETEKRRLSDIFREVAEHRAQTAEEALRRLNSEHSLLELELTIAKRETFDAQAISAMRETTIKSLETRLEECEAKILVLEKFCRENNLALPATYNFPEGDPLCERHDPELRSSETRAAEQPGVLFPRVAALVSAASAEAESGG